MMLPVLRSFVLVLLVSGMFAAPSFAQKKQYPSLLWEITGNGLKKPSYLFGTMHVSSKMVFHLSDSFYQAIRGVDVVALELDPERWQDQMMRLQDIERKITRYSRFDAEKFINERSFRTADYAGTLEASLREEPMLINGLLYRTAQPRADFEEDTYLDLYIYQTGRKLGKRGAGVENYYEAERLMTEAYADMFREKKKKPIDTDGESMYDIEQKAQDAYRKGDLDLLDSLDRKMQNSEAFTEKFLYKRNEIQAHSMDTIIRNGSSLFAGVGAAHLAGPRGVIEILRKKGYRLRPIKMTDRDALQKDKIDRIRVPVNFSQHRSADGFFSVQLPGRLYAREDGAANENWQFADMSNGAYYMVSRIRTHAHFTGESEARVLQKVDSLLYENIPGKILTKKAITRNGYNGFDITNRTRRGDVQRYQIYITPFEVICFKMSGPADYVLLGTEAGRYFNSVQLQEQGAANAWTGFEPRQGGFKVKMPHPPLQYLDTDAPDRNDTWVYEALDKNSGLACLIWKKTVYNVGFIEEDSFDLSLMEESFRSDPQVARQLSRLQGSLGGAPMLEARWIMKDSSLVVTRFYIKGPHYYMVAARNTRQGNGFSAFFDSFAWTPHRYEPAQVFKDTIYKFSVKTPTPPEMDNEWRALEVKSRNAMREGGSEESEERNFQARLENKATGETVFLGVKSAGRYEFESDTTDYWKEELTDNRYSDFIVKKREPIRMGDSIQGYRLVLADTNSSRQYQRVRLMKGNYAYELYTITDTLNQAPSLAWDIFNSFKIETDAGVQGIPSVLVNKLDTFFADYYSRDTVARKRALAYISSMYFGKKGYPRILEALRRLSITDKDYFSLKSRFILELGFLRDSTIAGDVVNSLKTIYQQSADTATFQNTVLEALAKHKTAAAYSLLKELLVQDPPVFENSYSYSGLFESMNDSLALARSLFPEILQLTSFQDYKEPITSLLAELLDSGLLKAKDYEAYFPGILFDAKLALKKQKMREEKLLEEELKKAAKDADNADAALALVRNYRRDYDDEGGDEAADNEVLNYAPLLMPYYDKDAFVPRYFSKLLQSKDRDLQLKALVLLLKHNKPLPDTLFNWFAASDKYRFSCYKQLEKINRLDKFPLKWKNQADMARAAIVARLGSDKTDSLAAAGRQLVSLKNRKGYVYFFKYRNTPEGSWQMALSGIQPEDGLAVSSDNSFTRLTDKKIVADQPEAEQFSKQLKRLLLQDRPSAREFFVDDRDALRFDR